MAVVLAAGTVPAYPVHLTAAPRPDRPSRGLWLVKWLLVIPHVVVLALLWAAFGVLSLVALVTILATGRYPRAVFDFNVGVLRWTWRVAYYAYGALGTDRYPPFTLRDDPTYPARLHVDYPQRLSRGLALVKWWLLALPHYLVVAVLTDDGILLAERAVTEGLVWQNADTTQWVWQGGGLIALLALIAGVALLFTGRYPQGLYDLLLGLDRWVLRVAGYAGLMTDTYPPFRLDQGASEPQRDAVRTDLPGPEDALPEHVPAYRGAPDATTSRWTGGTVVAVVAGALSVVLGLGLLGAGATLVSAQDDGWVTSPSRTVQTSGYAVATEAVVLEGTGLREGLGQVRVRAEHAAGEDVFVGIARSEDAATYLAGVEHSVLTGLLSDLRDVRGAAPATPPQRADVWAASALGPGLQVAEISAQPGSWVAVVMPADATPGLRAQVDVAATLPWLTPAGGALLGLGTALLLAGVVAVALAVRAATVEPGSRP